MNSLKTLFVSAVMVAVLYGAYLAMNRSPQSEPPLDEATAWDGTKADVGTPMRAPTVLEGQVGVPPTSSAPQNATATVPPPKMTMSFNVPSGGPGGPPEAKSAASSSPGLTSPPKVSIPETTAKTAPEFPKQTVSRISRPSKQSSSATSASKPLASFSVLMSTVRGELARNRLLDAYRMLSSRYRDPAFSASENAHIERLLDQLAGTIVYSTQHYLERPHQVVSGETLEQLSRRYKVPQQLLAKINGLAPGQPLKAGMVLKVVRGPFKAEIDLAKHELTLKLPDGGYAGRFPVGVGRDVPQQEKAYRVYDKIETPPAPAVTSGGAPSGPLAKQKWIGLEGRLGIHASSNPSDVGRSGTQGGISMRSRDVDDLFDILSVGSQVVIRR